MSRSGTKSSLNRVYQSISPFFPSPPSFSSFPSLPCPSFNSLPCLPLPHHICLALSDLVLFCLHLSCLILSCLFFSGLASCLVLSLVFSWLVSCLVSCLWSCLVLSFLVLSLFCYLIFLISVLLPYPNLNSFPKPKPYPRRGT